MDPDHILGFFIEHTTNGTVMNQCTLHSPHKPVKKVKERIHVAVNGFPPHSYGTSPATWDHSITCYPTQANAPRLHPSQ